MPLIVEYGEGRRLSAAHAALVEPLIPQQMDLALFRNNAAHIDPRMADVFAHGKFPTEDVERQVILSSWLAYHEAAYDPTNPPAVDCFGMDVAATHDDTVLVAGGQYGVTRIYRYRGQASDDPRRHFHNVVAWANRIAVEQHGIELTRGRIPVCVDFVGIGMGAVEIMEATGVWVIRFVGSARSEVNPQLYGNLRTESYGELGRRLDPNGRWGAMPYAMPVDEYLREELTAPEKKYDSNGMRFYLSPKRKQVGMADRIQSVQEKIGRSPDTGDATVYMFHAVRVLGLWSSFIGGLESASAAYPTSMAEFQEIRDKVVKDATNPASEMDPDVKELIAGLMRQADRRGETGGEIGSDGREGLSARDRLIRQFSRRLD